MQNRAVQMSMNELSSLGSCNNTIDRLTTVPSVHASFGGKVFLTSDSSFLKNTGSYKTFIIYHQNQSTLQVVSLCGCTHVYTILVQFLSVGFQNKSYTVVGTGSSKVRTFSIYLLTANGVPVVKLHIKKFV